VSILLPTYNGARFLDEQVRSVLAQTLSTFELLIYDDGSTDGTWPILQAYAQSDSRLRAWQGLANAGQGAALTVLLGHAQAPLISFCDQDDVWAPDKLDLLVRTIGAADLAYGSSPLIDDTGAALGHSLFDVTGPPNTGRDPVQHLAVNTISAHAMLVRRDLLSSRHFNQPHDFDHLIAIAASARNGVVFVENSRTLHRIHDGNQIHGQLGQARPRQSAEERANSRGNKAQALAALTAAALNSAPEASPQRPALQRLHAIAASLLAGKPWVVNSGFDPSEVETLLRSLSAHEPAIKRVLRRFRKLARGPLHPANWLRVLS
jgi:hypothetical protein